jgi:septum formation protein
MLVLASASPRRRELLTQAGYTFAVHPAHVAEDPLAAETPLAYVTRLAREKAEAVFRELSSTTSEPLQVIGADTTVTIDNQILAKPESPADAARMLRLLSGRSHHVITGVAVVAHGSTQVAAEITAVRFLSLSDQEIEDYIATGEPWIKQALTQSRSSRPVGFRASKAVTSTSSVCRSPSSRPCSSRCKLARNLVAATRRYALDAV